MAILANNTESEIREDCTEISLNSVTNMFHLVEQDLISNPYIENLKKSLTPLINASIGRIGIDITDMECRVLEVILKGFTDTGYSGNYKEISKRELQNQIGSGRIDLESSPLESFPRFKFTQAALIKSLGIKRNQIGAISRAILSLETLSSKMFTIYYERNILDSNGKPKISNGSIKSESVVAQGSLLTLLRIQDSSEERLKNYEVILNPIFLEERENHCLLIPSNWRDEVLLSVGRKKISSTVFKFLIFLRYTFELNQRYANSPSNSLEFSQDKISRVLKIPESVIKNRKRTCAILEDCYSIAKDLGYLQDYKVNKFIHYLVLNEDKYCTNHLK